MPQRRSFEADGSPIRALFTTCKWLAVQVLQDPRQRRFFKAKDMSDLFTLGSEYAATTETSAIFAGAGNALAAQTCLHGRGAPTNRAPTTCSRQAHITCTAAANDMQGSMVMWCQTHMVASQSQRSLRQQEAGRMRTERQGTAPQMRGAAQWRQSRQRPATGTPPHIQTSRRQAAHQAAAAAAAATATARAERPVQPRSGLPRRRRPCRQTATHSCGDRSRQPRKQVIPQPECFTRVSGDDGT